MKKLILTLCSIAVVAVLYGFYYFSPILNAGSGFAAKNICSGHFLSGMSGQQIVDEALIPASSILSNTRYSIDETNQWVDANLFGLFKRRAVYSDGTGCTLMQAGQDALPAKVEIPVRSDLNPELPWPEGSAPVASNSHLQAVLESAFAEPDTEHKRNTKAVVVIHKGRLVAEQYAPGVDARTPLIGWSMTKSVTNMLVGLLVQDGRLALSQAAPVPPWHKDADDPRAAITIDQLLRMSSGLVFDEEYSLYSDVTRMLSAERDAGGLLPLNPCSQSLTLSGPIHPVPATFFPALSGGQWVVIFSTITSSLNNACFYRSVYPARQLKPITTAPLLALRLCMPMHVTGPGWASSAYNRANGKVNKCCRRTGLATAQRQHPQTRKTTTVRISG